MAPVTARLERRVRSEFGASADAVLALLAKVPEQVPGGEAQDAERLQAAIALGAGGDVDRVAQRVVLATTDWRDLLVGSPLAHADWRDVLDTELAGRRRFRRWRGRR